MFEIFIAGKEEAYAGQAARAAFDEIDRLADRTREVVRGGDPRPPLDAG